MLQNENQLYVQPGEDESLRTNVPAGYGLKEVTDFVRGNFNLRAAYLYYGPDRIDSGKMSSENGPASVCSWLVEIAHPPPLTSADGALSRLPDNAVLAVWDHLLDPREAARQKRSTVAGFTPHTNAMTLTGQSLYVDTGGRHTRIGNALMEAIDNSNL